MNSLFNKPRTSDQDLIKLAREVGLKGLKISFAADVDKNYAGPQILNIDHVGHAGTHWVCLFGTWFFDPLGCPPPPVVARLNPNYAEIQVQNVAESHCGQYCVFWALSKQNNKLYEFYHHNKIAYER